jgi:hypothetical protein
MIRFKILPLVILAFLSTVITAQENTAKIGLTDALLGHFNISYERVVNEKQSIQLKIGYWQPTLSAFINEKNFTPEAFNLKESKGGLNTSVEYRFYTTKHNAPEGLYIAPYIRFFNQSAIFTDEIDGDKFDVDTRLNTFGFGGQIGYQIIINEIVSVDFYFFGAGVDKHSFKFKYELQTPRAGFDYSSITDDVSEVFRDINYLEKRLKHEVNNDNLTSKLPFLFPGFRFGINAGIAF